MDPTESRREAAELVLRAAAELVSRVDESRRHVIALADHYGVDVHRIAHLTDLTVAEVTLILAVTDI